MSKLYATLYFMTMSCWIQAHTFKIESIHTVSKTNPDITYTKIHDAQPFEYTPFPLSKFPELQPHDGIFTETFIVQIPNGQVCSLYGWIKKDNTIISEFIPPYFSYTTQMRLLDYTPFEHVKKIKGKVAVITLGCAACFGHWIYNILGRLALLELSGVAYDYLYVTNDQPYMKDTLALWGIDPAKIITPSGDTHFIEADELIVPSLIGLRTPKPHEYPLTWVPLERYCQKWNIDPTTVSLPYNTINKDIDILPADVPVENYFLNWTPLVGSYFSPWVVDYLRNKFLPLTTKQDFNFSKKVFISRKDSSNREIMNEEEVFEVFKAKGFKRYVLGQMSMLEQIALFNQADIIVAAHGSGLNHQMFCRPGTTIVEIYQHRSDCCFYYLSQVVGLQHHCLQVTEFKHIWGFYHTGIPPIIFQRFIDKHPALFD